MKTGLALLLSFLVAGCSASRPHGDAYYERQARNRQWQREMRRAIDCIHQVSLRTAFFVRVRPDAEPICSRCSRMTAWRTRCRSSVVG